jgi:type I restriction enzyme S subunit
MLKVGTPAGWEMRRVGDLVELTNGFPFRSDLFGPDGDLPLVRIRDLFSNAFTTFVNGPIPDEVVIRDGDIVIGMDGDFELTVWGRGPAALNQRMCLLRPRPGVDARFVAYALPRHLRVLNDLTFATTVKHLSSLDILSERILCPRDDEQKAVADHLDVETARIDSMLGLLSARLDVLDERFQAAILADLAAGSWPAMPLRRLARRVKTGGTPPYSDASGVPWYTPASFADRLALGEPVRTIPSAWLDSGEAVRFPANSTLIVGIGATAGRVAHLDHLASGNQQLTCVEVMDGVDARFVSWLLWTRTAQLRSVAPSTTLPIISNELLKAVPMACPPWSDQVALAHRWDEVARRTAFVGARTERLRAVLKERREAIVAAAVTGQLEIPRVPA